MWSNTEIVERLLNERACAFAQFAARNGLVLNGAKTQLMIGGSAEPKDVASVSVVVNNDVITPAPEIELLGVTFDRNFSTLPQEVPGQRHQATVNEPTSNSLKATQVAINDVARTVIGQSRGDRVRIPDLLHRAGLPSLNQIAVKSVAIEAWKAFQSTDGGSATQVAINDVARTVIGQSRGDRVRIPDLLHRTGLPSLNQIAVKSVAIEAWKAFQSTDGGSGAIKYRDVPAIAGRHLVLVIVLGIFSLQIEPDLFGELDISLIEVAGLIAIVSLLVLVLLVDAISAIVHLGISLGQLEIGHHFPLSLRQSHVMDRGRALGPPQVDGALGIGILQCPAPNGGRDSWDSIQDGLHGHGSSGSGWGYHRTSPRSVTTPHPGEERELIGIVIQDGLIATEDSTMPGTRIVLKGDEPDPDPSPFLFLSVEHKRKNAEKPYDPKRSCWVPDDDTKFTEGLIEETSGGKVKVKILKDKSIKEFKQDQVTQVNPPKFDMCEDMSGLTYLNDASVLHNLKVRYMANLIYTYSGLFCIAVNPYQRFPIYTARTVDLYRLKRRNEVPPHIFAIAEGSYHAMTLKGKNQSILITGESGAGKTENTKKVITYFAFVGSTVTKAATKKKASLEDQVVQTNPVMEAYGNAKTVRNDNSSRFGKFIRVWFNNQGRMAGGDIEVYLLEKSRVTYQSPDERSYHIFYFLMTHKIDLHQSCRLSDDIYDYPLMSMGKVKVESIDDMEEMVIMDEAFDILGFTPDEKTNVYKVTSMCMILSRMEFVGHGEVTTAKNVEAGTVLMELFKYCDAPDELYDRFCNPKIKIGMEWVNKSQNLGAVQVSVGSIIKNIYGRLFRYLVDMCNNTLVDPTMKKVNFIGVLDIAGFEIFEFNTLEQLMINFVNEKLQQFFNHHMFVLEQEEYLREGIEWVSVDFGMDLAACIDLFEKPMGLIPILEEETIYPKANDKTFEEKLKANHLGKHNNFQRPNSKTDKDAHFAVVHYAGTVSYNVAGWLDKNRDPVNDTVIDLFKKAKGCTLLNEIFADHAGQTKEEDDAPPAGHRRGKKRMAVKSKTAAKQANFKTVCSYFKDQLNNLINMLMTTEPKAHKAMKMVKRPVTDEKKNIAATHAVMEKIQMSKEKFGYGHTKIFFRAGVLGLMEEIRDDKVNELVTCLQSWIRGNDTRMAYKKLWDHKRGLYVAQRTIRNYLMGKKWLWWQLWLALKPNLKAGRFEEFKKELAQKTKYASEHLDEVVKQREIAQKKNNVLVMEVHEMKGSLSGGVNAKQDLIDKIAKIEDAKGALNKELQMVNARYNSEQENIDGLAQTMRKLESSQGSLAKDIDEYENKLKIIEEEKLDREEQIRQLKEEIAHQEDLIAKLNRERRGINDSKLKDEEQIQSYEDKCNHLGKLKMRLEKQLDEVEDSWEREKKYKQDIEKLKRQVENNLKLTQEAVSDLERNRMELSQSLQRKEKELGSLVGKIEDEQTLGSKLNQQIKELQTRIEELDDEVEQERQSRVRADKAKANLRHELDDLNEKLEETGSSTSAQIALNARREEELAKLKKDLDECNISHESTLAMLRQKHNGAISDMGEQIDILNKQKANDMQNRLDEIQRALHEADSSKRKLMVENCDLQHHMEESERHAAQLSKDKTSFTTQLDDAKRLAEVETRERINLLGKMKNLEHDLETMREHLEEEYEAKQEIERQLSKALADINLWKTRYETEGLARTEEIERDKGKVAARLAEAEETISALQEKIGVLEKSKVRQTGELEEASADYERFNTTAAILEKRGRNFDKIITEWKCKADDLQGEIEASQSECRNFSSEFFRIKSANEELVEQLDTVKRENKNLAEEIKDLLDQLGEGGRSIHELDKSRRRLEVEKEELQAALEEAEAALEQEENKVLRSQLEMAQVRQEIDRRIQEKEEEFDHSKKNHMRAMDSMQASLEAEARSKEEALRIKKKLESDINEMEIALDHANKAHAEAKKAIKRTHNQLSEVNQAIQDERKVTIEVKEKLGLTDRKSNALAGDMEEAKALLDTAIRSQKQVELELQDTREHNNDMQNLNNSLTNTKRKLESDIHQMHADLDNLLSGAKNSEEKAKKAMVDAGRLADELRAEQEHSCTQERAVRITEKNLSDIMEMADEAARQAAIAAQQMPAKMEARIRELEFELGRTTQLSSDTHKHVTKGERKVKELQFQSEENAKNQERITDLVDKLQQKIKSYKKQIEDAEEIAAINLAKFRKAQQELEEADERTKMAEDGVHKFRPVRGSSVMN
eukprot:maker-scaffold198_size266703-snap-gene-1.28 protein:Tk12356 transcript:maker-scaffold198_size266703-snap-gene-1.28-mRNA-1 annotation:"myosin heavy muscle isoform x29"